MSTVTTGMRGFVVLASIAAAGVLGSASLSWAQYQSQSRSDVLPCSLSGVNPADHAGIFGNPAIARSYGFVQTNGQWRVSPSLCGRGGAAARAQAAPAAAKGGAAPAKADQLMSDGMCWLNTNGTNYRWGACK